MSNDLTEYQAHAVTNFNIKIKKNHRLTGKIIELLETMQTKTASSVEELDQVLWNS